jgi:hypothetical protein
MKIYVCHSTNFDYESELYAPLRKILGDKHELLLPHDAKDGEHSKNSIKSSDLVLAEVSYPSTGQGIELGWADAFQIPIICMHASSSAPSGALRHITCKIVSYNDKNDMMQKVAAHFS